MMVMGIVPVLADFVAFKVSLLDDDVGFEENEAVTPVGRLAADKLTLPTEPLSTVTEIVVVALLPALTDTLDGEADNEKLGAAFTVSVTVAVAVV